MTEIAIPTRIGTLVEVLEVADETLAAAAKAGDREAFSRLVARYRELAFAYTYAHLRSREDAEDVVQGAFVRAYQALDRFELRRCWGAWLMQIVRNGCRDALRRRRSRPVTSLPDEWLDPTPTPEAAALAEERSRRLAAAVDRLSENERVPLLMHYGARLTCKEIALALQLPESTVKGRLAHGLQKIRRELAKSGPDGDFR